MQIYSSTPCETDGYIPKIYLMHRMIYCRWSSRIHKIKSLTGDDCRRDRRTFK